MAPQTLRSRARKRAPFPPPRASRRRSLSRPAPGISTPGKAVGKSSRSMPSLAGPRLPTLLGSYRRGSVPGLGAEQYRLAAAPLAERGHAFDAVGVVERAARILAGADLRPALLRKADEPDLAGAVTSGGRSGAD